jgi:hypothetical protein
MAKAKGSVILQAVRTLRQNLERAQKALPPELQPYLTERIIVSQWYPEEHYHQLAKTVVAILPPMPDPWDFVGRMQAQIDLSGTYRAMLRPGDGMATLKAMPEMWRMHHDSGTVELRPAHEGAFVEMADYAIVSRELCAAYTGFMRQMVEMSLGKDSDVRHVQCRARGEALCSWRVRFLAAAGGAE